MKINSLEVMLNFSTLLGNPTQMCMKNGKER